MSKINARYLVFVEVSSCWTTTMPEKNIEVVFDHSHKKSTINETHSNIGEDRSQHGISRGAPGSPSESTRCPVPSERSNVLKDKPPSARNQSKSCFSKWLEGISLQCIFSAISSQFQKWTAIPVELTESIYFDEDDCYDSKGNRITPTEDPEETKKAREQLELEINFDPATHALFEIILQHRREAKEEHYDYHNMKVELSQFPEWNDLIIDRYRTTFQMFDISKDGLVDFKDFCEILADFGDSSPLETKKKHFEQMEGNKEQIDFLHFLKMVYELTMTKQTDPGSISLAESFRNIDDNMQRIRKLDVVERLQAGLF